jgi:uncharacterized protein with FMN-binding domain
MKRAVFALVFTVVGLVLLLRYRTEEASVATSALVTASAGAAAGSRQVTGTAVQTTGGHGPVQLQVTFSGSQITAVTALRVPSTSPRSQQLSATAVPKLVSATLTAQSADVDTVSGATQTSEAYVRSLQSALDKK